MGKKNSRAFCMFRWQQRRQCAEKFFFHFFKKKSSFEKKGTIYKLGQENILNFDRKILKSDFCDISTKNLQIHEKPWPDLFTSERWNENEFEFRIIQQEFPFFICHDKSPTEYESSLHFFVTKLWLFPFSIQFGNSVDKISTKNLNEKVFWNPLNTISIAEDFKESSLNLILWNASGLSFSAFASHRSVLSSVFGSCMKSSSSVLWPSWEKIFMSHKKTFESPWQYIES